MTKEDVNTMNPFVKPRTHTPIIHFGDNMEFQEAFEYWKDVLQLNDWCICAKLERNPAMMEGALGVSDVNHAGKTACIVINSCPVDTFPRWCEELALVHELLHCVIVVPEESSQTIEGVYYSLRQEQMVESMAKSMLMAKYGVDMDWFAHRNVDFEYKGVAEQ